MRWARRREVMLRLTQLDSVGRDSVERVLRSWFHALVNDKRDEGEDGEQQQLGEKRHAAALFRALRRRRRL